MSDIELERLQQANLRFRMNNAGLNDAIGDLRSQIDELEKGLAQLQHEADVWDKHGLVETVEERNQLREQLSEVEAEHGEQLRSMRSFSGDLEIRLEEAEKETRKEAKRANNAALRAERNALALTEANAAKAKAEAAATQLHRLLVDAKNDYAQHSPGCIGMFYKDSAGVEAYPCRCGYREWQAKTNKALADPTSTTYAERVKAAEEVARATGQHVIYGDQETWQRMVVAWEAWKEANHATD